MDLTLDEAKAIINGTDSRSEAYRRNDPDTMAAVEKAWQNAYPGERALTEDPVFEEKLSQALVEKKTNPQPAAEQTVVSLEELSEVGRETVDVLKQQWGEEDFNENYQAATKVVRTFEPQFQELEADFPNAGNDPDVLTVLSYFGLGRGHEIPPDLVQRIEQRYPGMEGDSRVKSLLEGVAQRFRK